LAHQILSVVSKYIEAKEIFSSANGKLEIGISINNSVFNNSGGCFKLWFLGNSLGVSIWVIRACGWLVFQIVTPHDHSLCICVWVMSIRSTIKHVHDD